MDEFLVNAIIVECKLPKIHSRVEEAKAMAKSIGYNIVDTIVQKRNSVHHSYCIGKGKLEEVKKIVNEKGIDTIIFTNTLPSSQIFKIKKEIGRDVKTIDRNLLILEVFEKRARTSEAKLQIKLARLKYTFSWGREFIKLRGIIGEQVGWSGPGDYPFKEYEKAARKKISKIRKSLIEKRFKKELQRNRRKELGFLTVALAGYTQSGKTTFFNKVVSESKPIGLGPFTTLSTYSRLVKLPNGKEFILLDSIGFIDDMHPIILDAFTVTLSEIAEADLVLLFFDVSESLSILRRKLISTNKILREINLSSNIMICANKIDLVNHEHVEKAVELIKWHFPSIPIFRISSKTGENIYFLLEAISQALSNYANSIKSIS
ncbi:MAG: GTPase HflX [Candidatus Bathyarchaeia archaeon]